MLSLVSFIAIGIVLGIRHATDADHVIAITTIVSRQGSVRHATFIGALWGIGHTLTICVVGTAIIVFHVIIPPRVGLAMELCVGLMLILLGVLNFSGLTQQVCSRLTPCQQPHPEDHSRRLLTYDATEQAAVDPAALDSSHHTSLNWFDRSLGRLGAYQLLRPLIIGVVHGLAGSAAVSLLVLATIRNAYWGIAYLLVFGLGTIAGMIAVTFAIAAPVAYTSLRFDRMNRSLAVASGVLSLVFGLVISWQTGIAGGLITSHPSWIPR